VSGVPFLNIKNITKIKGTLISIEIGTLIILEIGANDINCHQPLIFKSCNLLAVRKKYLTKYKNVTMK
jgi:hypothetical protein